MINATGAKTERFWLRLIKTSSTHKGLTPSARFELSLTFSERSAASNLLLIFAEVCHVFVFVIVNTTKVRFLSILRFLKFTSKNHLVSHEDLVSALGPGMFLFGATFIRRAGPSGCSLFTLHPTHYLLGKPKAHQHSIAPP